MIYIPSALSERECYALAELARNRSVVEVGSLLGRSTLALAKTARHVTAVDRHTGYDGWRNDTLRQFQRNLDVGGVAQKTLVVVDDFRRLRDFAADLTFIDLDGTFQTTLEAIRLASSPLIAVHDYQRTSCRGVEQAVHSSRLRVRTQVDSLIILER